MPGLCTRPPDYSDAGNADAFANDWRGSLKYCEALGWLYFNGKNWEQSDLKALQAAQQFTENMLVEALSEYTAAVQYEADMKSAEGTKEERDEAKRRVAEANAFLAHSRKSRGRKQIMALLELAKPSLEIKAAHLDAKPFLLNTPDGVIDLNTGKLKKHDADTPYLFCTHITAAGPLNVDLEDDLKGHVMWYQFLNTITCGDNALADFLQLMAGMALIGKVYHEGIVIANGSGRNGKSTFFNALAGVMGDYAGSIDPRVLTTDRQNKGAALATLRGKRLVIAAELEEHQRLSTSTLKQLASTDKLTIEEKFRAPETIEQTHTLVLFTNFLPRVGSTDNGTWRRLTIVPFNAVIDEKNATQNYAEKLVEKAGPAILSWAVEGAQNFIRNGFKLDIPECVAEATEEYRERENWLENFIADCCVREPGARFGARELYLAYKDWSQENGEFVRRERDFAAAMETAGYQSKSPGNKKMYLGLRVVRPTWSGAIPYGATG